MPGKSRRLISNQLLYLLSQLSKKAGIALLAQDGLECPVYTWQAGLKMVRTVGLEPTRGIPPEPKSGASTYSATLALGGLAETVGFEPTERAWRPTIFKTVAFNRSAKSPGNKRPGSRRKDPSPSGNQDRES